MVFKGLHICCPSCGGELEWIEPGDDGRLACLSCHRQWPVVVGIPDLRVFPDPYIDEEADRDKGRRIEARFDELEFAELVEFYYSITPAVPAKHAKLYSRGLATAVSRGEAALAAWELAAPRGRHPDGTLLDVGCGTAPLLVAAAPRAGPLVGIDIALRWLVLARKRLAEAGVDAALICACAESLPFPDETFDRVVAESVLENVKDQNAALSECHRVLCPSGSLALSTPNRFSLGPDPHTGVWGGSWLPDRWVASIARRHGGIPPRRNLLSARSLARKIEEAGFAAPTIVVPDIPPAQRRRFGTGTRLLIDAYRIARRLPVTRAILRLIGPLLHAVAAKRSAPG